MDRTIVLYDMLPIAYKGYAVYCGGLKTHECSSYIKADFIEAGVDCLDPMDPMAGMDLGVMKREYGHKVALKGNVNCVGVLDGEDKQSIIDETKRAIGQGGPGGGFVLSSSYTVHSGISFQNHRLMVETLQRYGTYPLEY